MVITQVQEQPEAMVQEELREVLEAEAQLLAQMVQELIQEAEVVVPLPAVASMEQMVAGQEVEEVQEVAVVQWQVMVVADA
jgi:hypothetical protein